MKVLRTSEIEEKERGGGLFKGRVTVQPVLDADSSELRTNIINFDKGAVNVFHVHDFDQVLYVTKGRRHHRDRKGGDPHQAGRLRRHPGGREALARRHTRFGFRPHLDPRQDDVLKTIPPHSDGEVPL
jgi:hypothetical protein